VGDKSNPDGTRSVNSVSSVHFSPRLKTSGSVRDKKNLRERQTLRRSKKSVSSDEQCFWQGQKRANQGKKIIKIRAICVICGRQKYKKKKFREFREFRERKKISARAPTIDPRYSTTESPNSTLHPQIPPHPHYAQKTPFWPKTRKKIPQITPPPMRKNPTLCTKMTLFYPDFPLNCSFSPANCPNKHLSC
jgi:hypothetical protein